MSLAKKLSENQVVLVLTSSGKYNHTILDIAKALSKKKVLYITLNKTYESLHEIFTKKKVDMKNFVFIDAISKTFKQSTSNTKDCFYCSSPGALTEISLTVSKYMKEGFEYIVFDSLSSMAIYQKGKIIAKFVSDMIHKIKDTKTKAIFHALSDVQEHEAVIKEASMFVDEVIELDT